MQSVQQYNIFSSFTQPLQTLIYCEKQIVFSYKSLYHIHTEKATPFHKTAAQTAQ